MDTLTKADKPHQEEVGWVCPNCRQTRGPDGHDPCIKNLPGVKYACCGHGFDHGYLYFENGIRIGMKVTDVCYDDERRRINMPHRFAPRS